MNRISRASVATIMLLAGYITFNPNLLRAVAQTAEPQSHYYYDKILSQLLDGTYASVLQSFANSQPNTDAGQQKSSAIVVLTIYQSELSQKCGKFLTFESTVKAASHVVGLGLGVLIGDANSAPQPDPLQKLGTLEKIAKNIDRDLDQYIKRSGGCKSRSVYDLEDGIEAAYQVL